jgi:hypothetical protein
MGSSGKRRTTMAKLNRESKLRQKRAEKQARKAARKLTAASDGEDAPPRQEELDAPSAELDAGAPNGAGPESVAPVSDVAGRAG